MDQIMVDEVFMRDVTDVTGAMDAIKSAKIVEFNSLDDAITRREVGITGQSIKQTIPLAVEVDGLGYHYVNYNKVLPVAVAAMKEVASATESVEADEALQESSEDGERQCQGHHGSAEG